ncbi:hypothetical protein EAF00_002027 [Botryotinia globosa]|nr:hypothetical protein EAF00_002027 [Botryotinia globosa]
MDQCAFQDLFLGEDIDKGWDLHPALDTQIIIVKSTKSQPLHFWCFVLPNRTWWLGCLRVEVIALDMAPGIKFMTLAPKST